MVATVRNAITEYVFIGILKRKRRSKLDENFIFLLNKIIIFNQLNENSIMLLKDYLEKNVKCGYPHLGELCNRPLDWKSHKILS